MTNPILSQDGLYLIFRWIHFMVGIVWIGHLYYFNFTQGPFFAETDAQSKSAAIRKLVPRALWWFRWGAAFTFFSGLIMLWYKAKMSGPGGHEIYTTTSWGIWIMIGAALGTLMAANVWFIIWPAQKVVIASANAVANGGTADPTAAAHAARAGVASRTNVLFSIPMLFFMGAASHLPFALNPETSLKPLAAAITAILLLLEINAIKGKTGPMTSIAGVIHCGLALTVVLYFAVCFLV
ncbi:MAG: urate hydroxylase PuuD [Deltaproteobacteria bacterium]|nr:urate hydroxylase PuuD [Deltaproteobacteria bacterium]